MFSQNDAKTGHRSLMMKHARPGMRGRFDRTMARPPLKGKRVGPSESDPGPRA